MTPTPPQKPKPKQQPKQQPRRPAPKRRGRQSSAATWTWLSVALVIVVVLAVVLTETVLGSPNNNKSQWGLWSPTVQREVTQIPASVFNTVGVSSPTIAVSDIGPPSRAQKLLTFKVGGKELPGVVYLGAEYCPYCAATRWAVIAALSRFGTFSNVSYFLSSATDIDADTPTFTFVGSRYTSKYVEFLRYEVENRKQQPLQTPPAVVSQLVNMYNPHGYFPFMDIGNKVFIVGAAYDPAALEGATWSQIAAGLSDPTSPVTQAIVTTANYITAGICESVKDAPTSVCQSPGVLAALAGPLLNPKR